MATATRPKESKGVLEPTKDTLAVENGVLFDYYPIKLGERRGDFLEIVKLPPVLKQGYVTYQKKLYKLELKDFLRSRVYVGTTSNPIVGTSGGTDTSTSPALVTSGEVDITSVNPEQSGPDNVFGVQVNQAADLAWEEQVAALLYLDDPEEEWDVQTSA